jgi:hypothetical protein
VFVTVSNHALQKTCFANQRSIEGLVNVWQAEPGHDDVADLAGVVTAGNPLVTKEYLKRAPACPSAPHPTNPAAPTLAEGAYSLDAAGYIEPCSFGGLGAHGTYH